MVETALLNGTRCRRRLFIEPSSPIGSYVLVVDEKRKEWVRAGQTTGPLASPLATFESIIFLGICLPVFQRKPGQKPRIGIALHRVGVTRRSGTGEGSEVGDGE